MVKIYILTLKSNFPHSCDNFVIIGAGTFTEECVNTC